MKKFSTKMLVTLAMLLAMEIVLSRFLSIQTSITRIGFGFVPLVIAGVLFGPVPAAIVAVLGDVLGALLFPTGAFFPGLTVTACLVGLVYGLFLYKKSFNPRNVMDWVRVVVLAIVRQGLLGLCLQSYWLSILWGSEYKAVFATRIPQCLFLAAVEIIMIPILIKVAERLRTAIGLKSPAKAKEAEKEPAADSAEQLFLLKEQLKSGLISQEEYDAKAQKFAEK